ncbi:hypothetical protein ABZ924_31780 [Streptomyces sp. NPDC046876]|uniref:hypothetical protein n=1 Tax=Streptomyces sp. NPDC046876 TaxID=3155616 RepID=UPI0033DD362F
MPNNDKPVNGNDVPSFLDLLSQLPPEPRAPELGGQHGAGRLAGLRAAWKESWEEGGFLYQRWRRSSRPATAAGTRPPPGSRRPSCSAGSASSC